MRYFWTVFSAVVCFSILSLVDLKREAPHETQRVLTIYDHVGNVADKLGVSHHRLATVIWAESSFNHQAYNVHSGAYGLIQWTDVALVDLGVSKDELLLMGVEQQCTLMLRYFQLVESRYGKLCSGTDLYLAVFWPKAIGKGNRYVLFKRGSAPYAQNIALDYNGDGVVMRGEIDHHVRRKYRELIEHVAYYQTLSVI